jgi:hypothetical protein
VTLKLCDLDGRYLGDLPSFEVDVPWWPETAEVVAGAAQRYGADIWVLRLLHGSATEPHPVMGPIPTYGGSVTYLAQLRSAYRDLPLRRTEAPPGEEPLRGIWAEAGGPDRILAWADDRLASIGRPRTGPAEQVRSWNLSSILRLPTGAGSVWCKSVPPFFGHEGRVIAMLERLASPGLLPPLLAYDDELRTVLLDDVAGEDLHDCSDDTAVAMVDRLVELQWRTHDRIDEMLALGLPDWRADALTGALDELTLRADVASTVDAATLAAVRRLVDGMPDRFARLAECGIPEALVHGDAHAGNWRGTGAALVLLDWGDSGVGHPLLDAPSMGSRSDSKTRRDRVADRLVEQWMMRVPHANARRALDLAAPIAALRQALVYQTFIDGIEPAEHVYHEGDVPTWLQRAAST